MSPLMTRPLTRPVCVPCACPDEASRSHTLAVQSADPVTANLRTPHAFLLIPPTRGFFSCSSRSSRNLTLNAVSSTGFLHTEQG